MLRLRPGVERVAGAAILAVCLAGPARAGETDDSTEAGRIFGVLPNYTTVDSTWAPQQTTRESFKVAGLGTFDPFVYPFVGLTTELGQGGAGHRYATRYGTAFADNAAGNFMTTAIVPSLTHQDSRYYRRGEGGFLSRFAYSASRSVVTRTRGGAAAFNVSEIGGAAATAGLSNLYHPTTDRTTGATLSRWGTQVMWDTLGNELKEFWPDIRTRLHRQ